MPKSKRSKLVHLNPVQKKTRAHSDALYSTIRDACAAYTHVFVFSVDNMRNTYLKDVRSRLPTSRLFFGKTKVMAKALGATVEEEALPGLSGLSRYLSGNVGLLFSNQAPAEVEAFVAGYERVDFARAGVVAGRDFVVPAGVVCTRGGEVDAEDDLPMAHSLEGNLRQNGMPTRLVKGKVMLDDEYVVCREGMVLNSQQTSLLKTFGVALSEFRVRLVARYDAAKGEVVELEGEEEE